MQLIVFLDPSSRLSSLPRIDSFICSEFLDGSIELALFDLVKKFMFHGPCHRDQCLDSNGFCSKHFPKPQSRSPCAPHGLPTIPP